MAYGNRILAWKLVVPIQEGLYSSHVPVRPCFSGSVTDQRRWSLHAAEETFRCDHPDRPGICKNDEHHFAPLISADRESYIGNPA